MSLEAAISWYENNHFNAAEMQRATGLSERSQRELLKLGILQAVPQSRTATRLFDARMLKRASLIYPFHEYGGFSLLVSGKLIYADSQPFCRLCPQASTVWASITRMSGRSDGLRRHSGYQ